MAQIATLEGHRNHVIGVAWSPDGLLLASLSCYDNVRLWSSVTWVQQSVLNCTNAIYNSGLAFSPNGRLLAAASDKKVRLFDVGGRAEVAVLEGHQDDCVTDLAFSPCGTLLAMATEGLCVHLSGVPACCGSDQPMPAGAAGAARSESVAAAGSDGGRSVRRRPG